MTRHDPRNEPEQAGRGPARFNDSPTETTDVSRIHMRIVSREQIEPEEGLERPPWWLWAFSVLLLFGMGFYIGRYGGSFSVAAHEVEEPPVAGDQPAPIVVRGDQVYAGVCQPCHQAHGHGIPGQYPPLVGSDWLLEDHETPIRILLHGLSGPVVIKGRTYNNRMPPFHDKLSNEEIAAVITYARSGWGNNAPPVTPALVDSIRQQTQGRSEWTAAELLKLRPPQLTKK